jgi:hypothetical protein
MRSSRRVRRHQVLPARLPPAFVTDLVNNGLPIHIGASLLGHLNVQTTRGYVAVFEEDVVRDYQQFLDRRRAQRPAGEYRTPTAAEMTEFEEHFDKRRVELGSCGRPYGTPCAHEHACIRCHMLSINPTMLTRLNELEEDLLARRQRAIDEGWRGEVEGLELTLTFLRSKRDKVRRTAATGPVSKAFSPTAADPEPACDTTIPARPCPTPVAHGTGPQIWFLNCENTPTIRPSESATPPERSLMLFTKRRAALPNGGECRGSRDEASKSVTPKPGPDVFSLPSTW